MTWQLRPSGSALAVVEECGPFDVMAHSAHELVVDGRSGQAVHAARAGLAFCERSGDEATARYLRFILGTALNVLGRHAEAEAEAHRLLARLGTDGDPFWRAKALSLLADARIGQGDLAGGMVHLAEGQALVGDGPLLSDNHLSARHAIALTLSSLFLMEPADDLLASLLAADRPGPHAQLMVVREAAVQQAAWSAVLMQTGQSELIMRHLRLCQARALRMRALARLLARPQMASRAEALYGYCLVHAGEPELGEAVLRAALADLPTRLELTEVKIAHLALARALVDRGDHGAARDELGALAVQPGSTGLHDVWAYGAAAVAATLDVAEAGPHPAVERWHRLAQQNLLRQWNDWSLRYRSLQDHMRLRQLLAETERMGRAVLEDPLTGVGNRRLLQQIVEGSSEPVRAVFVDVDRFKQVNDAHSHDVGDQVLRRMADLLRTHCRAEDVVIRYGGDEFVVLLAPGGDHVTPENVAARVHAAVQAEPWSRLSLGLAVTVSVGVSSETGTVQALSEADAALLTAKRGGRDQVVVA